VARPCGGGAGAINGPNQMKERLSLTESQQPQRVAKLARSRSNRRCPRWRKSSTNILGFIEQLNEVDVDGGRAIDNP